MRTIHFKIAPEITERFAHTRIGYVVADFINTGSHPTVDQMKRRAARTVSEKNYTQKNWTDHPRVKIWRETYRQQQVRPKKYPSSAESLFRRVVRGEKPWTISPVVDLYNTISATHVVPMGGYDVTKLQGDAITLRLGREGETMTPLGRNAEPEQVQADHVVYADNNDERVICWLWNYKDSKDTFIEDSTNQAIFFLDSTGADDQSLDAALEAFKSGLTEIGANVQTSGIVSADHPEADIRFDDPDLDALRKSFSGKSAADAQDASAAASIVPAASEVRNYAKEYSERSAIHAAATGNTEHLRACVEHHPGLLTRATDGNGSTTLHHTVRGQHFATLAWLLSLENAPSVNQPNSATETPLMIATRFFDENPGKSTEAIRLLLQHRADPSITNKDGETALDIAYAKNITDAIAILELPTGATATSRKPAPASSGGGAMFSQSRSPLKIVFKHIQAGHEAVAIQSLAQIDKHELNQQIGKTKVTLLIAASCAGMQKLATELLDKGANVNAVDGIKQWNAYKWAISESQPELASILEGRGAEFQRDGMAASLP
jgi:DNA/RNA-binding domain of Phe-tRNA-synthetase-like protein/ankyrin repeat protein